MVEQDQDWQLAEMTGQEAANASLLDLDTARVIIANELKTDPEKISPADSLIHNLGCDSLDVVNIMMEIEERIQASIPDDDIMSGDPPLQELIARINRTAKPD